MYRCATQVTIMAPVCEIKNVNSIRFIKQAIEYEARRQVEILEEGGTIVQETRLFDANKGVTRSMRSKEEAHDYRYFPDPDLLPLELDADWVEELRAALPELPDAKKARFISDFGLSAYDASVLVSDRDTASYFETVVDEQGSKRDPKTAANWVISELFGRLNRANTEIVDSPVSAEALGGLLDLIADDTISGKIAKDVFNEMFASGKSAVQIVDDKGLQQITDTGAIDAAVDAAIAASPDNVAAYQAGNEKLIGWFVGQVMKATQGKANPKLVNQVLLDKLNG